tara:strand:+ start:926 stop:1849 length:924 start_codon:yes stop_codon:yes gene_type:complete
MAKLFYICIFYSISLTLGMSNDIKYLRYWESPFSHRKSPNTQSVDMQASKEMDANQDLLAKKQANVDIKQDLGQDIVNATIDSSNAVDNSFGAIPAVGTPERKAYYDLRNWKYDDTIPQATVETDPLTSETMIFDNIMSAPDLQGALGLPIQRLSDEFLDNQYNRMAQQGYELPPKDVFIKNLNQFADRVAGIESEFGKYENELGGMTSAKGRYQFTDDSVATMKQRLINMGVSSEVVSRMSDDPRDWSRDQEDLAFMGNIFAQSGSDMYIRNIGMGDISAMSEGYKKFHHTNPDQATLERMKKFGL